MPSKLILTAALSLSLGLAAATPGLAQIERQHGAHVHGVATGNLAQDGPDFRLELEIPGINLVGFEHAPRTEAQQQSLDAALDLLNRGEWLVMDGRGQCEIDRLNAHTHGFDGEGNGDYGDQEDGHEHHDHHHGDRHAHHAHDHAKEHEHHHDHDHDHKHHDHGHHEHEHGHDHAHAEHGHHHDHEHAEFHIVAHIRCQAPDALRWIDLNLFEEFPGNERMDIDLLTDRAIGRAELTPGRIRIDLSGR
ncbi:MAG: DUF2796 domain-containing protein [Wenzhouxiangella sp.]|nr:MAG: DUF2796 domain-containing protein [Wenzhouxiangella sp.]